MREFELLKAVFARNAELVQKFPGVTLPPGDDMGAVRMPIPGAGDPGLTPSAWDGNVLVTVDQVADGVHVDLGTMPLEGIGRKAITRNLSDVAAMAARPLCAVAAACLPRDFGEAKAATLFEAMRATATHYQCPLIGGDVSVWDGKLIVTVTVLAWAATKRGAVLRSGAQVGDAICVTGELGGSLAGHHLTFEPRIEAAVALAETLGDDLHAMIDLSDGLGSDLAHICRASAVDAELWLNRLPIRSAAVDLSRKSGRPTWEHALGDGEDYELCFTAAAARVEGLRGGNDPGNDPGGDPGDDPGLKPSAWGPVRVVGRVTRRAGEAATITGVDAQGGRVVLDRMGWEHEGTST